jgi:hypothetical protein
MAKTRWIALAGPLTILVGSMWLVASIGDFALQTGLAADEAVVGIVAVPFFFSFIPLLFALIATRLRFYPSARSLGRLGLALSVAGSAGVLAFLLAVMLLNRLAPALNQPFWVNYVAVICVLSIRVGYILFGIDGIRYRLLPRWNLSPLLLGLTVLLSLPLDWFGVPAFLPTRLATPFLHFAVSGICWILFGVALMDPRQDSQPTAAS